MTTNELRNKFLDFFAQRGHQIVPGSSLIPKDDRTLLFTGSGMNQFKEEFLGRLTTFRRAVSCQKCLRTADLEKVGRTAGHHTFFEMLGNFSFGDYFKEEAILWAWEFLTKELKLKKERIWVSVYKDDLEAEELWKDKVKFPQERIIKLGPKENFWPSNAPLEGPNGPCGPCSEIFYDRGEDAGCKRASCNLTCDCGRFVEVWNLVFTQFNRKEIDILEPLPNKNIDTGMGLERMMAILEGADNNFQIDIFRPICDAIIRFTRHLIPDNRYLIWTIADHIRAVIFAISDGVLPSNENRGYVIRKLIRKSIGHGQSIGIEKPFLCKLVPTVVEAMKEGYPQLQALRENIAEIVYAEEERFLNTLREGNRILKEEIVRLESKNINILPGKIAFELYDTFGFPVELTQRIAEEKGMNVALDEFQQAMDVQRQSGRLGSSILPTIFKEFVIETKGTEFVGYDTLEVEANIVELLKDNKKVLDLKESEGGEIILDKTVFYGEAGGQVGDMGNLQGPIFNLQSHNLFEVCDTKREGRVIRHLGKVARGEFKVGDKVLACVDKGHRLDVACNHSSTHLLQSVLRKVLGSHIQQAGSLVEAQRLRFDFTHFKDLSKRELDRIEELVNEYIRKSNAVEVFLMDIEEAKRQGALALFDEKYEDEVRVVSIGGYSKELCAGTHVKSTGAIGLFKIIQESSVSSGVRRIEAITGNFAYKKIKEDEIILESIARLLESPREKIVLNIETTLKRLKASEKELSTLKRRLLNLRLEEIISKGVIISNRIKLISYNLEEADLELMRFVIDRLKERINKSAVFLLGSCYENKVYFVCSVTEDLIDEGLHAGLIVKKVAEVAGGSGGGRADLAEAGGKECRNINLALAEAAKILTKV